MAGPSRIFQDPPLNEIPLGIGTWTARVLVEEKWNVHNFGSGQKFQKLVLADEQGNKVQGIIWDENVDSLQHTIKAFKTYYYIRGPNVSEIRPNFRRTANGLTIQWTIDARNFISSVEEPAKQIPYPPLHTIPVAELPPHVHAETKFDLLAVVAKLLTPRNQNVRGSLVPVQEAIVIDEQLKPLMLTLWGEYAINQGNELMALRNNLPTILCRRVKATAHDVLSLSTTPACYVAVEPDLIQAKQLKNWANNNISAIRLAIIKANSEELNPALTFNPAQQLTPVAFIDRNAKSSWIQTMIEFQHLKQDYYFLICPACSGSTCANRDEEFHCNFCDTMQRPRPRCKLYAELIDPSGRIQATFFHKLAEKLFQNSADDILLMDDEAKKCMLIGAEEEIKGREFILEVRKTRQIYGQIGSKYTVHTFFPKEKMYQIEAFNTQLQATPCEGILKVKQETDLLRKTEKRTMSSPLQIKSSADNTLDESASETNASDRMDTDESEAISSKEMATSSYRISKQKIE